MLTVLLAAIAAQTAPPDANAARTPPRPDPYALCRCAPRNEELLTSFAGVAADAIVTVEADGRSPADRQATIFKVQGKHKATLGDQVRVWHNTRPAVCGVTFDYGRRYTVVAFKTDAGLETDWCLDPRRAEGI